MHIKNLTDFPGENCVLYSKSIFRKKLFIKFLVAEFILKLPGNYKLFLELIETTT